MAWNGPDGRLGRAQPGVGAFSEYSASDTKAGERDDAGQCSRPKCAGVAASVAWPVDPVGAIIGNDGPLGGLGSS